MTPLPLTANHTSERITASLVHSASERSACGPQRSRVSVLNWSLPLPTRLKLQWFQAGGKRRCARSTTAQSPQRGAPPGTSGHRASRDAHGRAQSPSNSHARQGAPPNDARPARAQCTPRRATRSPLAGASPSPSGVVLGLGLGADDLEVAERDGAPLGALLLRQVAPHHLAVLLAVRLVHVHVLRHARHRPDDLPTRRALAATVLPSVLQELARQAHGRALCRKGPRR